jgi:Dinucleotide-utilizing enzymes involved in molybdopterin and thiamine biosynthesis family 1
MSGIDDRSVLLLGEENVALLKKKKVAVFGLGGVGGTCFEALCRAGVGHLYAIDRDVVDESNLNRQILFTRADVGTKKAGAAFLRAKSIRLDVEVLPECYSLSAETLKEHDYSSCDFLVDAMDDIPAKIALIHYALDHEIPFLISLGMGNRLDPSAVTLCRLDKTEGDPLAKKLRSELREEGVDLKKITAVVSTEIPLVRGKKPASLMMVPSSAGLLLASSAIKSLLNIPLK